MPESRPIVAPVSTITSPRFPADSPSGATESPGRTEGRGLRQPTAIHHPLLFEGHPHAMWVHDVETRAFLEVNEAAVRRYGYSRDEFLAMTVEAIDASGGGTKAPDEPGSLRRGTLERHRLKDGTVIEVEATSSDLDHDGRPGRLVLINDVSSRFRTEEALRDAEAKYRGIFENAVEGIFQTSPEGRYLDANPALARIYGFVSPAEMIADLTDIGSQLYVQPGRRDEFARRMQAHDAVSAFESQVRRRDGAEIWISESSRAVRDAEGRLLYYEGIVEDITDRKRAEEEIRALNDELECRLERVQALRRIDVAIAEGRDLALTLDVCLDQVITQLRPDATVILLCDPRTRSLRHAAGRGLHQADLRDTELAPGRGLAGRAACERRTVHVADLSREGDDPSRHPHLAAEGFVAYVAVPLQAKGEVKGVLEVFHREARDLAPGWLNFLEILAGQAAIAIDNAWLVDDLRRSNAELAAAYDATIEGWSRALDLRDEETEGHSRRVTEMTLRLARAMGMSEAELVHARRGALLHDIGKMGIPDQILHKPGPLSDEEWRVMRRHPQYAYDMLQPVTFLRPALAIPYCHHERWDGTGYPRGLKREEIPMSARIFAAVDIWDALRFDRPYRPAWPDRKVCDHLQSLAGTHLDPNVVRAFLQILFPESPEDTPETAPSRGSPRRLDTASAPYHRANSAWGCKV